MRLLILLALWLSMATSLAARATEPGSMRLGGIRPTWYPSGAAVDPAALCEAAVVTAEHRAGLPADLLRAISLTESGRVDAADGRTRAWPWTINAEGQGQFFPTRRDAVAAVRRLQARGVRSVDVGCLQVNLMYHPDAFVSLEEAFDPAANARYAAGFLNALYADRKTWAGAIAAYHSETPALGDPYRVLVMTRWQNGNLRALPMRSVLESAYRDFARDDRSYGAFAPQSRVYGAFAPR
jgi:Transglycosylase SLT domain